MKDYEIEKVKDILLCMGIQIKKAKKSLDDLDSNVTEFYVAIDAIQYDYNVLDETINKKES